MVLARLYQRPMYGYELIREIEDDSGGAFALKEGNLYPILHALESEGMAEFSSFHPCFTLSHTQALFALITYSIIYAKNPTVFITIRLLSFKSYLYSGITHFRKCAAR